MIGTMFSMVARDTETRSGNQVIRAINDLDELVKFCEDAKGRGHDKVTVDLGQKQTFKNGKQGYIARYRSWKATPKE